MFCFCPSVCLGFHFGFCFFFGVFIVAFGFGFLWASGFVCVYIFVCATTLVLRFFGFVLHVCFVFVLFCEVCAFRVCLVLF